MKFAASTVVAMMLLLSQADARKTFTAKDFEAQLRAGNVDTKKLLAKAIPYDEAMRRLENNNGNNNGYNNYNNYNYNMNNNNNNNNNNNGYNNNNNNNNGGGDANEDENYDNQNDYQGNDGYDVNGQNYDQDEEWAEMQNQYNNDESLEITGDYKLQFNSCQTLTVQNFNLLLDNLISYTQEGTLQAVRNYVLFDICKTKSCYKSSSKLYMVDLATFIESMILFAPSYKENYCEACLANAETCLGDKGKYYSGGGGNQENQAEEEAEDNDENRRRLNDDGNVAILDCSTCSKLDCWYDSDGDYEVDVDEVAEWIDELAECRQTEAYWNYLNLYAGWTCNEAGTGIEVGVFIDQYCRLFHKNLKFSNIMEESDYQYVVQSQDIIPMMFETAIDCSYNDETEFVSKYEYYERQVYQDGDGNQDGKEANEFCQSLFSGDYAPRDTNDCGQPQNSNNYYNYYQRQNNQEEGEEENYNNNNNNGENGQEKKYMWQYQQYNVNGESLNWYKYDVNYGEAVDGASVCEVVATKHNSAAGNPYDGDTAGTLYEYKANSMWADMNSPSGLSGLTIAWIVLSSIIVTAIFMHFTRKVIIKRRKKQSIEKNQIFATTDRKAPLIIS